ncbi:MAG TPA: amidohydrolase family protein [Actinomycetota bacterium]|nr:amidohydrolase family protein [Actinomycetota bacterium]
MTGAGLLLEGGTVFDGLGSPGRVADVAVLDGRVVAVGGDPPAGLRRVDCRDRYVAPGFVDTHAHSDLVHLLEEPQPFKLLQGVTTEVVGNCGLTFAPLDPASAEVAGQLWSGLAAGVPIEPWGFGELAGRLDRAGPANNLALLVGHGTLRLTANGLDERLRPGAAERMAALAAEAFEAGAVGLSSGLIYVPGSYADTGELVALARVAAGYGGTYATHMRDEGAHLEAALDEAVTIARAAGVRLQVSHCKAAGRAAHGRGPLLLQRLAAARLEGVDAQGDQYPYDAGATVLSSLLPPAVAAGGTRLMLARLRDPAARAALRAQAERGGVGDGGWALADPADVLLTGHADAGLVGRNLAEAAGGRDPWDALCDLVADDPAATIVIRLMREDDVRAILASPLVGVGSDSLAPTGLGHPRTWGCFPRLLGRYVREEQALTWAQAIRKATWLGARQFRLDGRGLLVEGAVADLCVFDPATVGHDGSYLDPGVPVTGIDHVVLAGDLVVEHGQYTGRRSGRVLRGPGSAATAGPGPGPRR